MECESNGINYAVRQSYTAVDKSDLSVAAKRRLLFSLYSFRCLFNGDELLRVNETLIKYGCSFIFPLKSHPLYMENRDEIDAAEKNPAGVVLTCGGVCVKHEGKSVLKLDAGSELFFYYAEKGQIADRFSSPIEKYMLYGCVEAVTGLSSATAELKAAWYLVFPYVISIGAPYEPFLYDSLQRRLATSDVFKKVILSKFSVSCADSKEELYALGMPPLITDWLLPYIEWKNAKDGDGVSREVKRYRHWLNAGRFAQVYTGTEKLLDTFPDDEDLLLLNIAARISLNKKITKNEHERLLRDTLNILQDLLEGALNKRIYFIYYYGLTLLGLGRIEEAVEKFNDTLEIDPAFKQSLVMLKALESVNIKS